MDIKFTNSMGLILLANSTNLLKCNVPTSRKYQGDSKEVISVLVYFQVQQFAFFEATSDVLPVPDFAQAFELTLGELFGWLSE